MFYSIQNHININITRTHTKSNSIKSVQSVQSKNQICLLDIDIQGAQNVKKSSLDAYYLFIAPPSMEELEKRLRGRGTEKEEAIVKRLANAKGELDYGMEEGNFDIVLVTNDLDKTFTKISISEAEALARKANAVKKAKLAKKGPASTSA